MRRHQPHDSSHQDDMHEAPKRFEDEYDPQTYQNHLPPLSAKNAHVPASLIEEISLHIREFRTNFIKTRQMITYRRESGSSEHDDLIVTMVEVLGHQIRSCDLKFRECIKRGGNEEPRLIQLAVEFQRLRLEAKNMVQQTFSYVKNFGEWPSDASHSEVSTPVNQSDYVSSSSASDSTVAPRMYQPDSADAFDDNHSVVSGAASSVTGSAAPRRKRIIKRVIRKRRVTNTQPLQNEEDIGDFTRESSQGTDSSSTTTTRKREVIGTANISSMKGDRNLIRGRYTRDTDLQMNVNTQEREVRDVLNEAFIDDDETNSLTHPLDSDEHRSFASSSSDVHIMPNRNPKNYEINPALDFNQAHVSGSSSFSAASPRARAPPQPKQLNPFVNESRYDRIGNSQDDGKNNESELMTRRVQKDGSRVMIVRKKVVRRSLPQISDAHQYNSQDYVPTHLGELPKAHEPAKPALESETNVPKFLGHGSTIPEALRNAGFRDQASTYATEQYYEDQQRLQTQVKEQDIQDMQEIRKEDLLTAARLQALIDEQLLREETLAHIEQQGSQLAEVSTQLTEMAFQQGETLGLIEDEVAKSRTHATKARREVVRAAPKYRLPLGWIGSLAGAAIAGPAGFFIVGLGLKGALIVTGAGAIVGAVAGRGVSGALAAANARQGMVFRPREENVAATGQIQSVHNLPLTAHQIGKQTDNHELSSTQDNEPKLRTWQGFSHLFSRMQDDVEPNFERSFVSETESDTESTPIVRSQRVVPRQSKSPSANKSQSVDAKPHSPQRTMTKGPTILTRTPTEQEWRIEQQMLPRHYEIQPAPIDESNHFDVTDLVRRRSNERSSTHEQISEEAGDSGFFSTLTAFFGGSNKKPSIYTTPLPSKLHDCDPIQKNVLSAVDSRELRPNQHHNSTATFSAVSADIDHSHATHPLRKPLFTIEKKNTTNGVYEEEHLRKPQWITTPAHATTVPQNVQQISEPSRANSTLPVQPRRKKESFRNVLQGSSSVIEEFEPASTWEPPPLFESRESRRSRLRMQARAAAQSLQAPVSSAPLLEDSLESSTVNNLAASVRATKGNESNASVRTQANGLSSQNPSTYLSRPYEAVTGVVGSLTEAVTSGASGLMQALDLKRKPIKRDWKIKTLDQTK